jgi:hypothetical protein
MWLVAFFILYFAAYLDHNAFHAALMAVIIIRARSTSARTPTATRRLHAGSGGSAGRREEPTTK